MGHDRVSRDDSAGDLERVDTAGAGCLAHQPIDRPQHTRPELLEAALRKLLEQAAKALDQALSLDPHDLGVLCLRGKLHLLQKEFPEGQEVFEQVLALDKEEDYTMWGLVGKGIALEKTSGAKAAEKAFNKVFKIAESPTLKEYEDRADAFAFFHDYERVEEDLKQAIALGNKAPLPYNSLAWLYTQYLLTDENLHQAIEFAKQAVELEGKGARRGQFLDTLGWIYFKLERYDEALGALEEALRLFPISQELRYHKRRIKRAQKKKKKQA